MLRELAHLIAEDTPPPSGGESSLLGIAAVISAIGVAIGGVVGSITALIKAFRSPTIHQPPPRHRRDEEEDDEE